ncbi:L-rhamnose mutarotase [Ruania rhizosphaerae]|uniref:L-rhamnose mutarotase n=1 Tax=Ruania rhizosphaerae TaxID=1840413 RepID=UPI001359647E|nr:L-rhamnose mutarotase [Ruania rhizosphaerae]
MPRYCFINRVRPDRLDEYTEAHAAVWPEMLEALRDSGWRNYQLYLAPDGLLVGHFEADDYDAAQAAMGRTAVNERWQANMERFFVNPGNPDEGFELLPEVFSLEDQLVAAGLPTEPGRN